MQTSKSGHCLGYFLEGESEYEGGRGDQAVCVRT